MRLSPVPPEESCMCLLPLRWKRTRAFFVTALFVKGNNRYFDVTG